MCPNEENALVKNNQCLRMPWVIRLEDQFLPQHQLGAAYQSTRIDHEMRLNVNCNPKLARLTGIMVTLGMNNSHPDSVKEAVLAGADIVRLNMSHKDKKWHAISVQSIRQAGNKIQKFEGQVFPLGVAMDLRGPEIRTGLFQGDKKSKGLAVLEEGNNVKLLVEESYKRAGTSSAFWVSCLNLPKICQTGDKILINHGVVLEVTSCEEKFVTCKILKGGTVKEETLVQLCDSILELPQISEQDDMDIDLASDLECDFLISSHTQNGKMVCAIKHRLKQIGKHSMCVLAKISSQQALDSFDDILKVADGIVFDRDIAFDIGSEKLFLAQKSIIAKCNRIGKPVVVGFQVWDESGHLKMNMGEIANAVLEGADTIFLTTGAMDAKETTDLIQKVDTVCREAESARWQRQLFEELSYKALIPLDPTHSVAIAAVEMSMKCNAAAIIVTTTTGRSAMMLSIYRPRCPIVAISRHGIASRWLQIYFGIHPIHYRNSPHRDWSKDMDCRIQTGMNYLRQCKFVQVGDAVIIVSSWHQGSGFTNCIRVIYASPGLIPNDKSHDFEDTW